MMASERTARTWSGSISGSGLARAKTIGFFAIFATISPVIAPATDRPTNTSAPTNASAMVRAFVLLANLALYGSVSPGRPS